MKENQTEVKAIAEQYKIEHFYPQSSSPFSLSQQRIKELLQNPSLKNKGSIFTHIEKIEFKPKTTQTNSCSNINFKADKGYYVCNTCYKKPDQSIYCCCVKCWDSTKHEGHQFELLHDFHDKDIQCACGLPMLFKKQSFCGKHQSYDQIIPCEINEDELTAFKRYYALLLEVSIQSKNDKLKTQVLQDLSHHCSESVYYCRMTFQVLSQKSINGSTYLSVLFTFDEPDQDQPQSFIQLDRLVLKFLGLFKVMRCDLKTRIDLTKLIIQIKKQESQKEQQNSLYQTVLPLMLDEITANHLIKQKYFNQEFKNLVSNLSEAHLDYDDLKTLQFTQSTLDQLAQQYSIRSISAGTREILINRFVNQSLLDSDNPWGDSSSTKCISSTLSQYFAYADALEILPKQETFIKKLENILVRTIIRTQSQKIGNYSQVYDTQELGIGRFFYFIKELPSSTKLIDHYWENLLTKQGKIEPIHQSVRRFYRILSVLANYDYRGYKQKIFRDDNAQEQKYEKQAFKVRFQQLLRNIQSITPEELQVLLYQGKIHLSEGNKQVLKKCYDFYYADHAFKRRSQYVVDNAMVELTQNPNGQIFKKMYNSTVHFQQKYKTCAGSKSAELIEYVLSSPRLLDLLQLSWKQTNREKDQQKSGYLYLFALILYDCLTRNRNAELHQRLKALSQNEGELKQFALDQEEYQMIRRLFMLKQASTEKSNDIQGQNSKKQEVQKCWICSDQECERTLVKPAHLKSSLAVLIYGKENCPTGISITTCGHVLHLNCFMKTLKDSQRMRFDCKICSNIVNCCIPQKYKHEAEEVNTKIRSVLMAAAANQFKEECKAKDEFLLVLSHLVCSKSLKAFTEPNIIDQNSDQDKYFLQWISVLFKNADENGKKDYLQQIDRLRQEIKGSPRIECRFVQLTVLHVIEQLLLESHNETKAIDTLKPELQATLNTPQLSIFRLQLFDLVGAFVYFEQSTKQTPYPSLLYSFEPPKFKNVGKAKAFFKQQKCTICNENSKEKVNSMCLFCKDTTCEECFKIHTKQKHKLEIGLGFVSDGLLFFEIDGKYQQPAIYFDYIRRQSNKTKYNACVLPMKKYVFDQLAFSYQIDRFFRFWANDEDKQSNKRIVSRQLFSLLQEGDDEEKVGQEDDDGYDGYDDDNDDNDDYQSDDEEMNEKEEQSSPTN